MKVFLKAVASLSVLGIGWLCTPAAAQGWDGVVAGKVTGVDAAGGNNLDFRVFLEAGAYCGPGTPNFGYMNVDYPNYQATASLIIMAWTTGKAVTLYMWKDPNGYCKIGYAVIR